MLPHKPGVVVSVNLSQRRTVRKTRGTEGSLILDRGFEGDAHAGDWHRQVSLLGQESIDEMVAAGLNVGPGDFAENITTLGIDLLDIPIGSLIKLGSDAILEISQIGKVCHTKCVIYYQAGDCVMPRDGLFAVVRAAGRVRAGDAIEVMARGDGTCDRRPGRERPTHRRGYAALAEPQADRTRSRRRCASRSCGSVLDPDHDLRRLDHGDDTPAGGQAELTGGLRGNRGHKLVTAGDLDDHLGHDCPRGHCLDGSRELVPSAESHESLPPDPTAADPYGSTQCGKRGLL